MTSKTRNSVELKNYLQNPNTFPLSLQALLDGHHLITHLSEKCDLKEYFDRHHFVFHAETKLINNL